MTRETAKLKSRLAGSRGSKRPRDDEVSNEHLSADDEDEESRVSVVKKKVKLDPFAMPKSKKQSKAENNTTNKPSSKISAPQTVALDDTESKVPPRSMQTNGVSRDNDAVSTSRKKRKKKRHRFSETTTTGAQEASVPNTNSQPLPVAAHTSDLGESPGVDLLRTLLINSNSEAHLNGPTNFAPTDSASALPLLNLDGPPSININGEDTSGPKKRKRRRKKKGSANDATVDV